MAALTEFVIQRVIAKSKFGSEVQCAFKLGRPRCPSSNKCVDLWSACDFQPMLKLTGHTGISISVCLQDGLFAKSLAKRFMARHNLFFVAQHCPFAFPCASDRELDELRLGIPLALSCPLLQACFEMRSSRPC